MKTIFHIDAENKWNLVISNVKNLVKEYNDNNYSIIVLANSEGVKGFLTEEINVEVNKLTTANITFKACNNALNKFEINKNELNKKIEVVSAGVYELTLKQKEGYSYIKA